MLTSYENFIFDLNNTIKYRAKNFVNTDCDINTLIHLAYNDIASNINIEWEKYPYIISEDEIIELPFSDATDIDSLAIRKVYKDVHDIVDENDIDLSKIIIRTDENRYKYLYSSYKTDNIGKTIYFIRSFIPNIKNLPLKLYHLIFHAMIEGIMYHIHASIPDPSDGQVTNAVYQRFYAEKAKLINTFPQIQYVQKHVRITDGLY